MPKIHPAFDMKTKTWFVEFRTERERKGGQPYRMIEAPSIRELLAKLPAGYTAIGYKQLEPMIIRKPMRRDPYQSQMVLP